MTTAQFKTGQKVLATSVWTQQAVSGRVINVEHGEDDHLYTVQAYGNQFRQPGGYANIADFCESELRAV